MCENKQKARDAYWKLKKAIEELDKALDQVKYDLEGLWLEID